MSTLDDDMDAMREALISALHDGFKDALPVHRIAAAVDVAMEVSAIRTLVDAAGKGAIAVAAYAADDPTPPAPVTAAHADFDVPRLGAQGVYPSIP